jgi:hypothetical protein
VKPRPPKVVPYFAGITFTHPGGHERALRVLAEMGEKYSNNGTHEPVSKEQPSSAVSGKSSRVEGDLS